MSAPVITTVRGDIDPARLGMTSMHEHLNADLSVLARLAAGYGAVSPPPERLTLDRQNLAFLRAGGSTFSPASSTAGDVDYTVAELRHFAAIGGRAIVDASPRGLRGNVEQLREASERADVHVVCATGLYTTATRPEEYAGWTELQQAELFLRDVTEGIDGTSIRAGMLKCALSAPAPDAPLDEVELATLRACARVSNETGVSVHVHSAFPMSESQVMAGLAVLLDDMAVDPDRIVMMHMDSFLRPWNSREIYLGSLETVKTIDLSAVLQVLDRGVTVGFDSWGLNVDLLPQDDDRLKALIYLARSGWDSRIVLGHDITHKPQGLSYGGAGFTWFPSLIPPALTRHGLPDDAYRRMTVDTPARVLAH